MKKYKGYIYTAAGATGWGISGVCSQYLFNYYSLNTSWLTSVRMTLSGILLLLLAVSQKNKIGLVFKNKKDTIRLFEFAILGLLFVQFTYLSCIEYSNSATATVLQALNVIMMAIFMAIKTRIPLTKNQIIAVALAILGTFLIITHGHISQLMISPLGLTYGLASAVGVVTYTLLPKQISSKYGNTTITGWGMLIGGICITLLLQTWNYSAPIDPMVLLMIAIIVIIGTAGGFSIYLKGVSLIGPQKATIIGCLEPVSATILSAVWLHTSFSWIDIVGFALILFTVYICTKE